MDAKAVAKWVRISPLKARLLSKELRGLRVDEALKLARFGRVKAVEPVRKCLESAIANAEHNYNMDVDALWVKEARVDRGPFYTRVRPGSRGKVGYRRVRTAHITIVVSDSPMDAKNARKAGEEAEA
ncbi:50S ribosomal protein L22 [Candidatus Acetothermia bacterium]|jgi:large subunit ribosomal protein L22|nr:50S ribosomal protein L22 [Candidatus Acetothermia bacterium]MCI2431142.1 50S ribosomal protein L22 [Candidatus Acetothermia bacterium]MCI2436032.1 50S ribosomal protein L22 [Candidatus Acetothermia bacterium]